MSSTYTLCCCYFCTHTTPDDCNRTEYGGDRSCRCVATLATKIPSSSAWTQRRQKISRDYKIKGQRVASSQSRTCSTITSDAPVAPTSWRVDLTSQSWFLHFLLSKLYAGVCNSTSALAIKHRISDFRREPADVFTSSVNAHFQLPHLPSHQHVTSRSSLRLPLRPQNRSFVRDLASTLTLPTLAAAASAPSLNNCYAGPSS
jgi:hypothetical protein